MDRIWSDKLGETLKGKAFYDEYGQLDYFREEITGSVYCAKYWKLRSIEESPNELD